jgi:hypothetical protein
MQIGHFSGHFPVKIQKFINDTCIPVVAECNIDLMNTHAILDIKYYAVKSFATVNVKQCNLLLCVSENVVGE